MSNKNLENKVLYRLIKVAYVLIFILISAFFVLTGWFAKPKAIVDDDNSYINCTLGKSYVLGNVNLHVYSVTDTQIEPYYEKEARILCAYGVLNDYSSNYRNIQAPSYQNYTLRLQKKTIGSWESAILWWVLGVGGSYIVLNIIRETLNYIFFGKSFDWLWLIIPILLVASEDNKESL